MNLQKLSMMNEIEKIYHNDVGIGFYWKKGEARKENKIQLIFRDIGFYLSLQELKIFGDQVLNALQMPCCEQCSHKSECQTILLRTPSEKIDLAVSKKELKGIDDLIKGCVFQIEINVMMQNICKN